MRISDKLTQEKLKKILEDAYIKGQEKENIQMIELLEEMKEKVLNVINRE